jgi:hypothetical protein
MQDESELKNRADSSSCIANPEASIPRLTLRTFTFLKK